MRHAIICALVLLIGGPFAQAAETPTKVLIAPFTEANEQQQQQPDWINRAIHQSVQDELAALSGVEVVPSDPAVALPATAQAKGAGVRYIVRGMIQRLNGEIRITGRVQNVDDGKTVGGFKATGPQHELFAIEDSIARQLKRVIAPMEAELEDPRPVATGTSGGASTLQPPVQPARGVFEGSDLQRALEDRDYLRRAQRRVPNDYTQPPVYYPPTYPPIYGGGYGTCPPRFGYGGFGYGGFGYGYPFGFGGDTSVIIVKPGKGNNGGGNSGGGGVAPTPRPPIQHVQTQRLRDAAVNPGNSGNFIGPAPHRAPAPRMSGNSGNVIGPVPRRAPAPRTNTR